MAARQGKTDDFSSDEAAKPSSPRLDPTASGASAFGLEEIDAYGETAFHAIVTDIFQIGRDPSCNLVLRKDSKTSRKHASIRRKDGRFIIEDNGSSNGTYVNDNKVTEAHPLEIGDDVRIGTRNFTFKRTP